MELWSNNSHKSVVLLTNNFELDVKDLEDIYKCRGLLSPFISSSNKTFRSISSMVIVYIQIQIWED